VKDYVRSVELHSREVFHSPEHAPGEAQADFGEALVVIAGVEQKAHYLAMDLPHSDDCFVMAFPAETTEAFLEGHVRAFAYFGAFRPGFSTTNTKIAVARILARGAQRTRSFSDCKLLSVRDKFGRRPRATTRARWKIGGYARRKLHGSDSTRVSWEELNTRWRLRARSGASTAARAHRGIGIASSRS